MNVAQLKAALKDAMWTGKLHLTDELVPNTLGNLAIYRYGEIIGAIQTREQRPEQAIAWFNEEEPS